jgi:hypothetical protein
VGRGLELIISCSGFGKVAKGNLWVAREKSLGIISYIESEKNFIFYGTLAGDRFYI